LLGSFSFFLFCYVPLASVAGFAPFFCAHIPFSCIPPCLYFHFCCCSFKRIHVGLLLHPQVRPSQPLGCSTSVYFEFSLVSAWEGAPWFLFGTARIVLARGLLFSSPVRASVIALVSPFLNSVGPLAVGPVFSWPLMSFATSPHLFLE